MEKWEYCRVTKWDVDLNFVEMLNLMGEHRWELNLKIEMVNIGIASYIFKRKYIDGIAVVSDAPLREKITFESY